MHFRSLFIVFALAFTIIISTISHSQNAVSQNIKSFTFEATQLNNEKTIWVYLPTSYHNSKKSYPVIYMHDGQNLFDAELSYAGEWQIDDYLDTLVDKESIIIGIAHGGEKRIDELTPYANEKYGGGKGNLYLNFIISDLKPYIDEHYRTKPNPKNTSIFGSSLGGLISFYAVIKFPNIFGKAGVFSPSFWINPEIYTLVKSASIPKYVKFYFLAGTKESETMVSDLEQMIELLKLKKVKPRQYIKNIVINGKHNEYLWSTNFPNAYQWLLK